MVTDVLTAAPELNKPTTALVAVMPLTYGTNLVGSPVEYDTKTMGALVNGFEKVTFAVFAPAFLVTITMPVSICLKSLITV